MIGHHLLTMGIPISEKVIRTVAVYAGVAILLRLGGKRDLAQLNTFDLVVVMLLSNVVQNAVIGNDLSLSGGLIGAAVLVAINTAVVRFGGRSDRAVALFEGTPTTLIRDGAYDESALRREGLRRADVELAVRRQGAQSVAEVDDAVLAPGGSVLVSLRPDAQQATRGDIAALRDAIAALDEKVSASTAR